MTSIYEQRSVGKKTDVLIVGGGIVGCGLLRDLSLHDIDAVVIDKKDFTSQTSQSSSKMLHGGIRYLENLDFKLVWEALHEKNLWLKLTPHLAKERKFYLPTFSDSKRPLWMLKLGMLLYDFLSSFQNRSHQIVGINETIKDLPGIRTKGLKGAGIYYDAVVDDGKLTLEVLYDALVNPKCKALNYVSLHQLSIPTKDEPFKAILKDELTGEMHTLEAKHVVFATGPFTDQVLSTIKGLKWKPCLLPSKGSHLWISKKALPVNESLVMVGKDDRVIFVIPWPDRVLVGTTEKSIEGNLFDLSPSQEEVTYLLESLKDYFPNNSIEQSDILGTYAGVRPLVKESDSNNDLGKTAREHKVFSPHERVRVIVGGKYTTFRVMVQDIAREICLKLNKSYSRDATKVPLRRSSIIPAFSKMVLNQELEQRIWLNELPRTKEDIILRRCGNVVSHIEQNSRDVP